MNHIFYRPFLLVLAFSCLAVDLHAHSVQIINNSNDGILFVFNIPVPIEDKSISSVLLKAIKHALPRETLLPFGKWVPGTRDTKYLESRTVYVELGVDSKLAHVEFQTQRGLCRVRTYAGGLMIMIQGEHPIFKERPNPVTVIEINRWGTPAFFGDINARL